MNLKALKDDFASCPDREAIYRKIIAWGKKLPPFNPEWKVEPNLVPGCQSLMYLHGRFEEGKLYFAAASDALISAGLASILISFYSGSTPEDILATPPTFLKEFGIVSGLTPGRANGLASLYIRIKQTALKWRLETEGDDDAKLTQELNRQHK